MEVSGRGTASWYASLEYQINKINFVKFISTNSLRNDEVVISPFYRLEWGQRIKIKLINSGTNLSTSFSTYLALWNSSSSKHSFTEQIKLWMLNTSTNQTPEFYLDYQNQLQFPPKIVVEVVYTVFLRNSCRDSKKGWSLEEHSIVLTMKSLSFLNSLPWKWSLQQRRQHSCNKWWCMYCNTMIPTPLTLNRVVVLQRRNKPVICWNERYSVVGPSSLWMLDFADSVLLP